LRSRPGQAYRIQEARSARELLGSSHPLARVDERLDVVATRSLAVAALLVAGVAARADGVPMGLSVAIAAGVVEAALVARAAVLAQSRREHALELIADGHGELPLDAVARQRRGLLDPARRHRLAMSFDEIRDEALHPPPRHARVRPIYDPRIIAATAAELTTVAQLLRAEGAGIRGLAMASLLLTEGGSPLYRSDLRLLQDELHRIAYHLAPEQSAPPQASHTTSRPVS
jgi:hypothetical protein